MVRQALSNGLVGLMKAQPYLDSEDPQLCRSACGYDRPGYKGELQIARLTLGPGRPHLCLCFVPPLDECFISDRQPTS